MTTNTATPHFQFSIIDLLLLTMLTMIGLLVLTPYAEVCEPRIRRSDHNGAFVQWALTIGCFTFVGTALGLWCGPAAPKRGYKRAVVILFYVISSWIAMCIFTLPSPFRSRISCSQSAGAAACKAFAEAQEIYRRTDYDGDGILEYSPTISGHCSLVERKAGAADLSLLDKTFGLAEGPQGVATPKAGYVFKVLHGQGPAAHGGAKSYFKADKDGVLHMTGGYALLASPAIYKGKGDDSYLINNNGTIFQRDLGPDTPKIFETMTEFNPDSTWAISE
jgi:hypothetical protein